MKIIKKALAVVLLCTSFQSISQLIDDSAKPKTIIGLNAPNRILDEYIVVLNDNIVDQQALTMSQTTGIKFNLARNIVINTICSELALTAQGTIVNTYTKALYGFSLDSLNESAVTDVVNDDRVRFVEVNQTVFGSNVQMNPTWGLDRVDQQNLPLDNAYSYEFDGTGITAYVVDSGVRTVDPEFGGRASTGQDFVNEGPNGIDCAEHGTNVAGTIGSETYGIAKNVDIVSVKILDCENEGDTESIVSALDWIIDNSQNRSVVNLSFEQLTSSTVNTAVNNTVEQGIIVVAAAGNGNVNACTVSPASAANAITVGATNINDNRSTFSGSKASNFGSCVDLFAPGTDISSTSHGNDHTKSGTSFAAPHVTGAVVLYLQENPTATPQEVNDVIINRASTIAIGNAGAGSPNKILNTINQADQYEEDDDNLSDNNVIGINNATQKHNFADDLVDWIQLNDQSLNDALDLSGGPCDNLSCTVELSNVSNNMDLCLQYAKAGAVSQMFCGLTDGLYSNSDLVMNNTNGGSFPSQCDEDYQLGWSHIKLTDNLGETNADKQYDVSFLCEYDEVVLDPPDVYENDDTFDEFKPIVMNDPSQHRNLNDDSSDWIVLKGEHFPYEEADGCGNYSSCQLEFTDITTNDICLQQYKLVGQREINPTPVGAKICNLANTSFEIPLPILLPVLPSSPYCSYVFRSSRSAVYYQVTRTSEQPIENVNYKMKLQCD